MKTTLHRTIAAIACVALPMAVASCGAVEDIRNGVDVAEITKGAKELADAADSSSLGLTWFEPTVGSWIDSDREVMCFVEDSAGGLTGTMRGANR